MSAFKISADQTRSFQEHGYLIIRGLFDTEEMSIVRESAQRDQAFKKNAHDLKDTAGGVAKLVLWNHAGKDVFGAVARSPRIVDTMETLLGDEVYHYHSKMSIKEPLTGGAWEWHQDYGYWYLNGCLYPDMGSALVAVDPNTRANGCLQLLKGSHKMGRIEHGRYGEQTGADPERIAAATAVQELVYAELDPGDTLFFHSNTLHRADANHSPTARWSLLCCYNTRHNNPFKESHHPFYEPLEKVTGSAIKEMGVNLFGDDVSFWNPDEDATVGSRK